MITAFINVYDDIGLLPDAVAYYRHWGADTIILFVVNGPMNKIWNDIGGLNLGEDVVRTSGQNGAVHDADAEAEDLNYYRKCFDGWHVIADLDEFHWYGGLTFEQLIKVCEDRGVSYAHSTVVDRVPKCLKLLPIHHGGTLYDTFPMACNLTEALGCNTNKAGFVRADCKVQGGHHYADGIGADVEFETHHFKWNDKTLARIRKKLDDFKWVPKHWSDEVERAQCVVQSGKIDVNALGQPFVIRPAAKIFP